MGRGGEGGLKEKDLTLFWLFSVPDSDCFSNVPCCFAAADLGLVRVNYY